MSDVHSVGGYVTAGSLFALGLAAWQVLVALLVGITIVYFLCNLVARPSQATGTPYPVASRISFGVLGANIPAIIRGLIAVAWYGIQTYLALVLLAIKLWPGLAPYAETAEHGFAGLSLLGWIGFGFMWIAQAVGLLRLGLFRRTDRILDHRSPNRRRLDTSTRPTPRMSNEKPLSR